MEWSKSGTGWNRKRGAGMLALFLLLFGVFQFGYLLNMARAVLRVCAPFLIGAGLAALFNVPLRFVEEKLFSPLNRKGGKGWKKVRRPLAAAGTFLLLFILAGALIGIVIPPFKDAFEALAERFPQYLAQAENWIQKQAPSIKVIPLSSRVDWAKLFQAIPAWFQGSVSNVWEASGKRGTGAVYWVAQAVTAFFFAAAVLMNKETLCKQGSRFAAAFAPRGTGENIIEAARLVNQVFYRLITGQVLEAVIIGLVCFTGMAVFRFPYAAMAAALIGAGTMIPVFGIWLGSGLAFLLILMMAPGKALWFLLFLFVLQQIQASWLHPKLIGESIGLPGFWLMVAVILGGNSFGVLGVVLAVPLAAVAYRLVKQEMIARLGKKGVSGQEESHN